MPKRDNRRRRTIWVKEGDSRVVQVIDQRKLPHAYEVLDLTTTDQAAAAIKDMAVRGAGLIGVTAGYGMYLAALEAPRDGSFDEYVLRAGERLKATRPTAINLARAVERQIKAVKAASSIEEKISAAFETAREMVQEDVDCCRRIGEHGLEIVEKISREKKGAPVHILTHCNAGWLAFVDRGTATAPVYAAFEKGIKVHVWVEETRPRNQGAGLTAWELKESGVPHDIIVDNAGGYVMQHGLVDMVITGTDRTTITGDVCNKIGTYKTALAARDNGVPFYVALPSSSLDWRARDGITEIPIEERDPDEVTHAEGLLDGKIVRIRTAPQGSPARNYAFDVTPARLVTGLITERGICQASEDGISSLFPEHR
jgi:methylthioribose-1-phosphate isomerase